MAVFLYGNLAPGKEKGKVKEVCRKYNLYTNYIYTDNLLVYNSLYARKGDFLYGDVNG